MSFDLQVNNGDLVLNNGDLATVTGQDKLTQDLLKIALTEAGANVLNPWYGSLITKTLIGSYISSDTIISVAQNQLQNAVQNLQSLQNIQVSSGQSVSPSEQIAFINSINIMRNTVDPRIFSVSIRVLNRAFGMVTAQFTASNM
jgi:hypothetical protein